MKRSRKAVPNSSVRDIQFVERLSAWFARHQRDLPWRRPRMRSGYPALVAEIMLQQTQVSRVVERFTAFMRRYSTVRSLARAREQDVLAMWNGLGYYRRARHLHAAAKMIINDFGGRVPISVNELRRLPGVGRYTAGAIASITHGQPEPIVDGNVQRVLARFDAAKSARGGIGAHAWSWRRAADLVSRTAHPGVFNEALMELGATICNPTAPRCDRCPVSELCKARRAGIQGDVRLPRQRTPPRRVHHHAVVLSRNGKILVQQRGSAGMWAAMWQTPTIESDRPLRLIDIRKRLGIPLLQISRQSEFEHHTTHRHITFHVYHAASRSRSGTWKSMDEIMRLPMSNAQRRVLKSFTQTPA